MSIEKVENTIEIFPIDIDNNEINLVVIKNVIKSKFFEEKPLEALSYLNSFTSAFKSSKEYEKMFRIEMCYLKEFSQSQYSDQTPELFNQFLQKMLKLIIQKRKNSIYEKSFCNYVLMQILSLVKNLTNANYNDAILLYNYGIFFFLNTYPSYAFLLLLQKGDLLNTKHHHDEAYNIYTSVFYYMHRAFADKRFPENDDLLGQLILSLRKIHYQKETHPNLEICEKLLSSLVSQDPDQLFATLKLVQDKDQKDYNLIQIFYHTFSILMILAETTDKISPKMITMFCNEEFRTIIKNFSKEISIFNAIAEGNEKKVADLIRAGINIHLIDVQTKATPLQYALKCQNVAITKILLEQGHVDPDESKYFSMPPICLAITLKNLELVSLLLAAGANANQINFDNNNSNSPLYHSITSGEKAISKLLILNGSLLTAAEEKQLEQPTHPFHKEYKEVCKKNPFIQWHIRTPEEDSNSPLFLIAGNVSSSKTPIFCPHALDGSHAAYISFAKAINKLNQERPIYGIKSPALNPDGKTPETIKEIAELYLKHIQAIQPIGPYIFLGWSFGGWLVVEMARMLNELDQKVIIVGLFDSVSPNAMRSLSDKEYAEHLLSVHEHLKKYWAEEEVAQTHKPNLETLAKITKEEQIAAIFPPTNKLKNPNLLRMIPLIQINLRAALNYNPPTFDTKSNLFLTCFNTEESCEKYGPFLGWDNKFMQDKSAPSTTSNDWQVHSGMHSLAYVIPKMNHFSLLQSKSFLEEIAQLVETHSLVMFADLEREASFIYRQLSSRDKMLRDYKNKVELLYKLGGLQMNADVSSKEEQTAPNMHQVLGFFKQKPHLLDLSSQAPKLPLRSESQNRCLHPT